MVFDVTFRKQQLGLGLIVDDGQIKVESSTSSSVKEGDVLVGINGESVRGQGLDTVLATLRSITARPLRLTFDTDRVLSGVKIMDFDCNIDANAKPEAWHPNDATLSFTHRGEEGSVELRGAWTSGKQRAVVAVRRAGGVAVKLGVKPGDTLVAVDSNLVVPPKDAKGVRYLFDKYLAQAPPINRLTFARSKFNEDVLYTVKFPAFQDEEDVKDHRRSGSFGGFGLPRTCATEQWGLRLETRDGALRVVQAKSEAARVQDVVVLMDNHRVSHYSILAFGVAADAAARDATAAKRSHPTVCLTLASPELFAARRDLFVGVPTPTAPPPEAKDEESGDSSIALPPWAATSAPASVKLAWLALSRVDRRKLAQFVFMLQSGVGVEHHVVKNGAPKSRTAMIQEYGESDDLAGIVVKSGYGTTRIRFEDITAVDAPMSSKYQVGSEKLAASFSLAYRDGTNKATIDLSASCAASAYTVAQGLLIARAYRAAVLSHNTTTALTSPAPTPRASQERPSSYRRARRRIRRAVMLTSNQNDFWATLNRGVVVNVYYARLAYSVRTPLGDINLDARSALAAGQMPVFSDGQYCRATVERRLRGTSQYVLKYKDGPYDADRPGVALRRAFPKGTLFVGVPREFILVHYSYQHHYMPFSILFISGLQIAAFIFYARRKPDGLDGIGQSHPVVGPKFLHYELISDFPQCKDRRKQPWRLFSYQLAHIGYTHLVSNMFAQLVFGIPVELVHGHVLVFLIYQMGVALGALTCAFSDIHKAVVGASGGTYTLVGLHSADILVNWRAMAHDFGFLGRITLCLIVPGLDLLVYILVYKDDSISYSAHIGGWIGGLLLGVALFKPVYSAYVHDALIRPLFTLLLVLYAAFAITWYVETWPPKYFINGVFWRAASYNVKEHSRSCCALLLSCDDVDKSDYNLLSCDEGIDLYPGRYFNDDQFNRFKNCDEISAFIDDGIFPS